MAATSILASKRPRRLRAVNHEERFRVKCSCCAWSWADHYSQFHAMYYCAVCAAWKCHLQDRGPCRRPLTNRTPGEGLVKLARTVLG